MFWDKIKEAFSKKENNDNKAIINTQKTEKNRFTMVVKSVNKENTDFFGGLCLRYGRKGRSYSLI